MDKSNYDPTSAEPHLMRTWLEASVHHPATPTSPGSPSFAIAVPPPNVTGTLHMGHALNGTIQDVLIRALRQRGATTKWIYGTDHAGIATQTQVERSLEAEGTSREALGREQFEERAWAWRERYGGAITEQFKRLGCLLDYEDERFTLDARYAHAVARVFVDLHEQGLIQRGRRIVNWDPGSGSAISDLEIEEQEVTSEMLEVAYALTSGEAEIVVATVRPETIFADVAIAVHPDDPRYRHLVGQHAIVPLVDREVPIIADEHVKRDFGTGALKITPAHDVKDFAVGERHGLDAPQAIGEDGRLTPVAGRFAGMAVEDARAAVVAALEAAGVVRGREEHVHRVPHSHRSGRPVQPLISLQWFMDMEPLAGPAIEAVRDGRIGIHPASQSERYVDWLENIRPWCISRQLWWGHQIPVWYRGDQVHCALEPPEGEGWERDPDVLDTWFSSALWPFATLGWPEATDELAAFYPTAVLSTARDILFLWVARMVMLGLRFTGDVPFRDVYVHSVIQAPDGRRMSKSLGTGIDPLAVIEGGPRPPVFPQGGDFPPYGADALRFGLLAMSSSQDVRFNEERVAQGHALVTKLFNAVRFVDGRTETTRAELGPVRVEDRWIASRLRATRDEIDACVKRFDFSHATAMLYSFVYDELCDWYFEMTKQTPLDERRAAHLRWVMRETLTIAHPFLPFVTEQLWSSSVGEAGLLVDRLRPDLPDRDGDAEREIEVLIAAISDVRAWRQAAGVEAGQVLDARITVPSDGSRALVAGLAHLRIDETGDEPAIARLAEQEVVVEIIGGVPAERVRERFDARRAHLEDEIGRAASMLSSSGFVSRAPERVVEAERSKLDRLRKELEELAGSTPIG